ncbi:hypothetical protein QR680_007388 [Steinernema hermaphroditum]|nr:hypothetical protein QR680_007388 [Steinernema hermaphroditum]
MDSVPFDFIDNVCGHLTADQLPTFTSLDSNIWNSAADSHIEKRKYFDVDVAIHFDEHGKAFADRRYQLFFRQVSRPEYVDFPYDGMLVLKTLDELKANDARFVKIAKFTLRCVQYTDELKNMIGDAVTTNYEEALDYIVSHLHLHSDFHAYIPVEITECQDRLIGCLLNENSLNFKRISLEDRGQLHQFLKFQVDCNPGLKDILAGHSSYCLPTNDPSEQSKSLEKYVLRAGPKKLNVAYGYQLRRPLYFDTWLKDTAFELELSLANAPRRDYIFYVTSQLHSFGTKQRAKHKLFCRNHASYWYGRTHPDNEKACVLVRWEMENDCSMDVYFCADKERLSVDMRGLISRVCVNKECRLCAPESEKKSDNFR